MAKSILLAIAIWSAASGVRGGAAIGLRALERGRVISRLSGCTAALIILGVVAGVAVGGGAVGAARAFAAAHSLAAVIWWVTYVHAKVGAPVASTDTLVLAT